MRPYLNNDHLPKFAALNSDEVHLVYSRLVQADRLPHHDIPPTGEQLFLRCRAAGLDHAGVVLPIAREISSTGMSAIEKLVGRPIAEWSPKLQGPQPMRQTMGNSRPLLANSSTPRPSAAVKVNKGTWGADDKTYCLSFVNNPKRPNTAGWERYNLWEVGKTVQQMIEKGMWRADVKWDYERSFVKLGTYEELQALTAKTPEPAEV